MCARTHGLDTLRYGHHLGVCKSTICVANDVLVAGQESSRLRQHNTHVHKVLNQSAQWLTVASIDVLMDSVDDVIAFGPPKFGLGEMKVDFVAIKIGIVPAAEKKKKKKNVPSSKARQAAERHFA